MKNPNTIEDELDAARIKLYEETKNMTSNERIAYINDIAEQTLKNHGIKIVGATREKRWGRGMVEYDLKLDDKNRSITDAGFDVASALEDR